MNVLPPTVPAPNAQITAHELRSAPRRLTVGDLAELVARPAEVAARVNAALTAAAQGIPPSARAAEVMQQTAAPEADRRPTRPGTFLDIRV
jgi:hypothetical protein